MQEVKLMGPSKKPRPKAKKGTFKRLIRELFSFYPRLLPITMCCIIFSAAIGAIPVSADDYDNTLTLTINGTDCATNGKNIVLYPNESDSVRKINTNEYYFRYSKILIFDGNGKLIEIGENMFADSPNETGSAQHNIYVPANGFAIAFSSGVSALNNCYNAAKEGAVFYNSTISVIYEVYGSYSGNTLTVKYDNPKAESATAKRSTKNPPKLAAPLQASSKTVDFSK